MYHVYMLLDPINHEPFYVGKGTGSQLDRLQDHLNDARKPKEEQINQLKCNKINSIIKKGDIVETSMIFFDKEDDAYAHERGMIQQYGRKINHTGTLTNICAGGRGGWAHYGKRVFQFTLDGEILAEYPSLKAASVAVNVIPTAIWNCLNEDKPSTQSAGYIWCKTPTLNQKLIDAVRNRKKQSKVVYQFDVFGNVINQYDSISDASSKMSINHHAIRSVCETQTGWLSWKFLVI